MFTALTPKVSILNMIRNKSSYERFESNLVSNKRASTQRLIEKFNLDKTNKKTQPSLIVEESDVVDDTTTAKTMEQVKVLNYSALTKKLDHHHQRVSPIVHTTAGVTSINSVKTLSPQIVKATTIPTAAPTTTTENRQLQDDEYFNVYYNANDIKYPSYVISNNASQQQMPRTRSRQSHQVNNLNANGEATIGSHSTFDFTAPLSSRKREEDAAAAGAAANQTFPLKNEHKIVTIMHRLPRKKSSSRRSAQSEVPTLFSEASTLTISEAKYPMINHLADDTPSSYHGPMSIQKIKKPDIFEMRAQNNLLVKSTSNLSSVSSNASLIDFSKNENRLVNNKYHYYLNNNEQNNPLISHNHRVSHFDTKRTNLQYLSEDSLGSIKTTTSSIATTQQPTFNSQKTHISMRPKRATTFFLTEELHPEEVLSMNNHNNRLSKRIDELSAENLKSNLEKISLKQIKTSLENNSSSINKSLNSILSKRNTYFRNDMLTQQQKAKLKAFQEKTTISPNVPHQNREIINKIYRAYNQNTKKFEGEPLDNLLNNDLKMPSINGAKSSAQNSAINNNSTIENRRAEKQKEFLDKIESVKENINSMHSISNYNQLIQKYKQANLKEIDKNMSLNGENTMNKIDNLLNKKSDGFTGEVGALPKKINVPYSSNPNLDNENEDPAIINEFSLTKSPLLDHNFSEKYPNGLHNRRSPMGSEENFNTRKKFFQNMVRESSISEDISLIPEINEQIDALSNSMQKKRVSFHENVIETDVESGNSIIKSIYN